MNLNKLQIEELNELLKSNKIVIPDFRRSIGPTGQNAQWIKKNLHIRNPDLHARVKELVAQL